VLVADWTNGDPAITRFLDSRGRGGDPALPVVRAGRRRAEELPQVLTPAMLIERLASSRESRELGRLAPLA
jgi:thiol:disulfide interchange protein